MKGILCVCGVRGQGAFDDVIAEVHTLHTAVETMSYSNPMITYYSFPFNILGSAQMVLCSQFARKHSVH